jgi:RNA polymerase sigma factor (sigma-70 family)
MSPPAEKPSSALPSSAPFDFGMLYRETVTPLRRYLARIMGDRDEAQDIAQDAFCRTYRAMQTQPVEKPRAFLFTTARHLASNFRLRRAERMQPTEAAFFESQTDSAPDAAQSAIARQDEESFAHAVLTLPPGCQQILVLRLHHGMSQREIATHLQLAPSTVGNQLARAIRLLRANPTLTELQEPPRAVGVVPKNNSAAQSFFPPGSVSSPEDRPA